jgi:hypothetical protein
MFFFWLSLPSFNTYIEYSEEQYFKPSSCFGEKSKFKLTQKNDSTKEDYCSSNNIALIRIPYTEINNIEKVLSNFLKSYISSK